MIIQMGWVWLTSALITVSFQRYGDVSVPGWVQVGDAEAGRALEINWQCLRSVAILGLRPIIEVLAVDGCSIWNTIDSTSRKDE